MKMSICSISSLVSIPEGCLFASVYEFEICELNKHKYTVQTLFINIQIVFIKIDMCFNKKNNRFSEFRSNLAIRHGVLTEDIMSSIGFTTM